VIDNQISFSSALLLRKDEVFQRKIKKVESYFKYLLLNELALICTLVWLFTYSGFTLLLLLL
jgi:hypothetical protein